VNDNTHGDHWNGEDFSIFSAHQKGLAQIKSKTRSRSGSHGSIIGTPPRHAISRNSQLAGSDEEPTVRNIVTGSGTLPSRQVHSRQTESNNSDNDSDEENSRTDKLSIKTMTHATKALEVSM
jgi:hypothetical protein